MHLIFATTQADFPQKIRVFLFLFQGSAKRELITLEVHKKICDENAKKNGLSAAGCKPCISPGIDDC